MACDDASVAMKDEDYKLSMIISPRGRRADVADLRQLLVNRLSDTYKAILRRSLRFNNVSIFCEECSKWTRVSEYPQQWVCPECDTSYRMEFAVYEEVEKAQPVAEQ